MKADDALDQISYMRELIDQTRARAAHGYPFFLLWGLVWVVGYAGSFWFDDSTWGVALPIGAIGSGVIGALQRKKHAPSPLGRRISAMNLILIVTAVWVSLALSRGTIDTTAVNFWPLALGIMYIINGLFIGREMLFIGGWLILAGAASSAMPDRIALAWMVVAGGGSLLLTGLLLRRQLHKS